MLHKIALFLLKNCKNRSALRRLELCLQTLAKLPHWEFPATPQATGPFSQACPLAQNSSYATAHRSLENVTLYLVTFIRILQNLYFIYLFSTFRERSNMIW